METDMITTMKESTAKGTCNQRLQSGQERSDEEVMLMEVRGKKLPEGGDGRKEGTERVRKGEHGE